jgi:hypothetical protein
MRLKNGSKEPALQLPKWGAIATNVASGTDWVNYFFVCTEPGVLFWQDHSNWARLPASRARLLGKTAGQPGKTAGQDGRARRQGKTAGQDCRARLPGKTAEQVSERAGGPIDEEQQSKM